MSYSISQNAAFMTGASVAQKVISFVYFTLIARMISVAGTGKYFLALSFTTIFVVFVDLGLTNVLVRESAKTKSSAQAYLSTVLAIKIVFGLCAYAALVVAVNALGYDVELRYMIYLSGVTMLFDSAHLSLYGILRALGDLRYEAFSIPASQFLSLLLGASFLYFHLPLIFLILAFTIPSMLNVGFAATVLFYKYRVRFKAHFDWPSTQRFLAIAFPFALAAIFARVYGYSDSILLSKLVGQMAVGWYSIPYKITFAFQFVPLAVVAALYPRFSEYFVSDKEKLKAAFEQGMKYLWLVSFPIAVGICVLAKDIILTLYTKEYLPSVLPLQILILSLIFSFASFPIGALLNACNRQATQTAIVGSVMLINIILNLILIPQYGVVGAAISAFVGNVLLCLAGYFFVRRITNVSDVFFLKTLGQVALASAVMGGAVWYIHQFAGFPVAIVVGAAVYAFMLFFTGTVTRNQLREAIHILRK